MVGGRQRLRLRGKDRKKSAEDGRSINDLSNDLIWRILLGLGSPLCLIRASCACKRWRRVVTGGEGADADQGRAFLRLARSLHPPTIVGQYHNLTGGDHRFVPSSPRPPAPTIDGSRFAVDDQILQKSLWTWRVGDCHGGLVLLRRTSRPQDRLSPAPPSLIVYDPLARQHHAIYDPPLVKDLVDSYGVIDTFLLDGYDGDISISNFRVIYRFSSVGGPKTVVFSTLNGWGENWSFQRQPADAATGYVGQIAGRVNGCLYVGLHVGSVIALDNATLLFSKVQLPIGIRTGAASTFIVVCSGAGSGPTSPVTRTTTTSVDIVHVCGKELELFRQQVHGKGEWVLERSIANLSEATHGFSASLDKCMWVEWSAMVDAIAEDGAGLAILSARSRGGQDRRWFFSIDVRTMKMRLLPEEPYRVVLPEVHNGRKIFNYTLPWPQFLRACP